MIIHIVNEIVFGYFDLYFLIFIINKSDIKPVYEIEITYYASLYDLQLRIIVYG